MACVSIIIPVHNTAPYLKKCVDSVRNQTLDDIEIILAENLSTDGSYGLCDELASEDDRIKVLHLDVAGQSHARNAALEYTTGRYIGYVDSDDHIDRTMYGTLYSAAVKYDADLVYCNFYKLFPDGHTSGMADTGKTVVRTPAEVVRDIFTETVSSSPCTKLFSRKTVERHPFQEGRFFEDHAVVYRMAGDSSRIVWTDKSFYAYYQRADSTCHTLTPEKEYHFFLAESGRFNYLDRFDDIPQDTRDAIFRLQVDNCVGRFRHFLALGGAASLKEETCEMRKIFCSVYGQRGKMSEKARKTIFKIKYFWPLYRMKHNK